jgi:DNA-binding NtrC family response regulator
MAKVLLIDDHDGVRMSFAISIEMAGHECHALDSSDGFEQHLENVDLVVTDLTMPVNSGFDVIEKTHQAKPGTPVIIVTGNAEYRGELKEKLVHTGAVDVLYKPIDLTTLMSAIAQHLPK